MISVVTITCREQAGFQNAADSLTVAVRNVGTKIPVEWIVMDERLTPGRFDRANALFSAVRRNFPYRHLRPSLSRIRAQGLPDPNHARNQALAAAQGDYVVFLDDNMVVSQNWLVHAAEARQAYRGFRSTVLYAHNPILPQRVAVGEHLWTQVEAHTQCSGIFGAPRDELDWIGGFDEAYAGEMGFEDLDAIVRLKERGLTFWGTRGSFAIHFPHRRLPGTIRPEANRTRFETLLASRSA